MMYSFKKDSLSKAANITNFFYSRQELVVL